MKVNEYMNGQNGGMGYALRIVQEKGIEGLEEECKFRAATNIPTQVERKLCDQAIEKIKLNTIDTIRILSMYVLRNEFRFGKKRIERFVKRFENEAECLEKEYVTWEDIIENMKEELGIEESIRKNV